MEQVAAAVVILFLGTLPAFPPMLTVPAMQTPPIFWVATDDPTVPADSSNTTNIDETPLRLPQRPLPHANVLDQLQLAISDLLPTPMTMALLMLLSHIALMLVPPKLKHRIRESWNLFWPPWQHRAHHNEEPTAIQMSSASRSRTESAKESTKDEAELRMHREGSSKTEASKGDMSKTRSTKVTDSKPHQEEKSARKSAEEGSERPELTEEQKAKLKERQKRMMERSNERGERPELTDEQMAKLKEKQKRTVEDSMAKAKDTGKTAEEEKHKDKSVKEKAVTDPEKAGQRSNDGEVKKEVA